MLLIKTSIGQSSIHGIGLFAAEPLAKGQEIWRNDRRFDLVVSKEQLTGLPEHMQQFVQHYGYESVSKPGHFMLEFDNARFMNHTESPNTDFSDDDVGRAARDIAVGEELLCDYREFCSEAMLKEMGFAVAVA